jgi:general secretion pathway protein A
MYTQFYGFSERPFSVTPDPKFLYLTESHRETLASMLYGIKEKRGFLAVTGEVGTGKTTLIYAMLNNLDEKIKTVHIFRKCTTFQELLRTILFELNVPPKGRDRLALWQRLDQYLLEAASRGETVVLIIDEAQNLSNDMLEEIRTLSNLETQKTKLLQIILIGQPELETKLNSDDLRQLRQRIAIRRKLMRLPDEEVKAYIKHRLRLVGTGVDEVFTTGAISLICRYSKGTPRVINLLCDNAFLIGYALTKKKVDEAIIREVIRDMQVEVSTFEETSATKATSRSRPFWQGDGFVHVLRNFFHSLWEAVGSKRRHSVPDPGSKYVAATYEEDRKGGGQ